ncbi:MAG: hypothetical protein HY901_22265 [Deltaproteobacteria bacterium]|nr:hypothetical protein [Deltaproteobacteria bacterium]
MRVAVVAAALLVAPRQAAAWNLYCTEIFNPHGQTTPPAGSTTLPGAQGGQNEDGFYQVGACEGTINCPTGLGGPEFAGLCTCDGIEGGVILNDGCANDPGNGTGFVYGTFDFGTVLKYTEANGKTPDIEPMAGNNSPNGGGEAVSVDWHIWGQGDLQVCDAAEPTNCICCYVPPPPK